MSEEGVKLPESVTSWLLQHAVTNYVMAMADPKYAGERKPGSRILNREKMRKYLALMLNVRKGLARALQQHPPALSEEDDAKLQEFIAKEQEFLAGVERDPSVHEHVWGEICALCQVAPDTAEIEIDKKFDLLQAQGFGRITILPGGIGAFASTYPDQRRPEDIN